MKQITDILVWLQLVLVQILRRASEGDKGRKGRGEKSVWIKNLLA
jgi:hypothetical protein